MTEPRMVAALFVAKDGAYFGLEGVDPWDEKRDARGYAGPHPVIAHPPCNKWSPLAYINQTRIPGYRVGDDGGCFKAALAAVDRWGGVLEHPAGSIAWRTFNLTKPVRGRWLETGGGWVTEVDQGRYGHRARKRTWLYVSAPGAADLMMPPELDWVRAESDAIVSGFTHQPKGAHVACEHRRIRPLEASRTPAAFRDVLIGIASRARELEAVSPTGRAVETDGLTTWRLRSLVVVYMVVVVVACAATSARASSPWPDWWARQAACIRGHEGWPTANTGNGYYGAYQFLLSTWRSVGGHGLPSQAPLREQTYRAWLVYRRDGWTWREWGTARACGLR